MTAPRGPRIGRKARERERQAEKARRRLANLTPEQKERHLQRRREWRRATLTPQKREQRLKRRRELYRANPEPIRAKAREWRLAHLEIARDRDRQRRRAERQLEGLGKDPLRRRPPARPGELRLAPAAHRVQEIGEPTETTHDWPALLGRTGQRHSRVARQRRTGQPANRAAGARRDHPDSRSRRPA